MALSNIGFENILKKYTDIKEEKANEKDIINSQI